MTEQASLPLYDDAQKTRLMEWVHDSFFKSWNSNISLSQIMAEVIEFLRNAEEEKRRFEKESWEKRTPDWFTWDGDPQDFLEHLYYAGVPGCVPFGCDQNVRRYVEISFGKDALEFLSEKVKKRDRESFSHYLAACSFLSTRLKRFTIPLHLELLAAAALRRPLPQAAVPKPVPTPAPMKTDKKGQGRLF
jgi:hypothetical protein